jgi:hypothetical protein
MITTVITRLITYIVFIAHLLLLLFLQFEKNLEKLSPKPATFPQTSLPEV